MRSPCHLTQSLGAARACASQPSFFWWETFNLTQRLVVVGFVQFIPRDLGFVRLLLGLLVCLLYAMGLLYAKPYKRRDLSQLAIIAQVMLVLIYLSSVTIYIFDMLIRLEQDIASVVTDVDFAHEVLGFASYDALVDGMIVFNIAVVVVATALIVYHGFKQYQVKTLRLVDRNEAPELVLSEHRKYHLFLSHVRLQPRAKPMRAKPGVASIATIRSLAAPRNAMPTVAHAPHGTLTAPQVWSTGQDQVSVIKRQLQLLVPGIHIFLDVDDLHDIASLEDYVTASQAVLVFLSSGYFLSKNCLREVDASLAATIPLVLVHETDLKRGGAPLAKLKQELSSSGRDVGAVFHEPEVPIGWYRDSAFQLLSLRLIAEEALAASPVYVGYAPRLVLPGELLHERLYLPHMVRVFASAHNPGAAEIADEMLHDLRGHLLEGKLEFFSERPFEIALIPATSDAGRRGRLTRSGTQKLSLRAVGPAASLSLRLRRPSHLERNSRPSPLGGNSFQSVAEISSQTSAQRHSFQSVVAEISSQTSVQTSREGTRDGGVETSGSPSGVGLASTSVSRAARRSAGLAAAAERTFTTVTAAAETATANVAATAEASAANVAATAEAAAANVAVTAEAAARVLTQRRSAPPMHMLLCLNANTFLGADGDILAQQVRGALAAKVPLLLVHERASCEFDRFFQTTPPDLVSAGVFASIAVPLVRDTHHKLSLLLVAKELGAVHIPKLASARSRLGALAKSISLAGVPAEVPPEAPATARATEEPMKSVKEQCPPPASAAPSASSSSSQSAVGLVKPTSDYDASVSTSVLNLPIAEHTAEAPSPTHNAEERLGWF